MTNYFDVGLQVSHPPPPPSSHACNAFCAFLYMTLPANGKPTSSLVSFPVLPCTQKAPVGLAGHVYAGFMHDWYARVCRVR